MFIGVAIFAPWIAPHSPVEGDLLDRFAPPMWMEGGSSKYIVGTDSQGMDLLSRIIYGARISMAVGLIATTISVVVGTVLGLDRRLF